MKRARSWCELYSVSGFEPLRDSRECSAIRMCASYDCYVKKDWRLFVLR